jgi:hypothetical protein
LKTRGTHNVIDAAGIANLLRSFPPKGSNWLPLMIDCCEELGTSLRIAAYGGFRLLVIVRAFNIRNFYLDHWFNLLLKLADLTSAQVDYLFFILIC